MDTVSSGRIDFTTFPAHLCYVYCKKNKSKPYLKKKKHFKAMGNPMKTSDMDFNFSEAVTLSQTNCIGRFPLSFRNIQKQLYKQTS